MYDGPSSYLAERERLRLSEYEYWHGSKTQGPAEGQGPAEPLLNIPELEVVRNAIQTVMRGFECGQTWDEAGKCFRRLVDFDVLAKSLEVLRYYELLLAKEPLVEQIANDWRKTGAFFDGHKGVV